MQMQQLPDVLLTWPSAKAAFSGDADIRYHLLGCQQTLAGALHAVGVVYESKVQPGLGGQLQGTQRSEVGTVRPTPRHRHVHPVNGSGHSSGDGVGDLYQGPDVFWLPDVGVLEVTIAEMIAQFDPRRHVTA